MKHCIQIKPGGSDCPRVPATGFGTAMHCIPQTRPRQRLLACRFRDRLPHPNKSRLSSHNPPRKSKARSWHPPSKSSSGQ